jgi:PIN domain nuclease of toxin-antitoxin system
MSGPRAAVADTHAILFYATANPRLGRRAAAHLRATAEQDAVTYVPAAVVWEIALLARVGRIDLRRSVRQFFGDLFSNPAFQPLDLTPEQVFLADELRPNDDPLDGLIVAAARYLDLPLLTRDAAIGESGIVATIW